MSLMRRWHRERARSSAANAPVRAKKAGHSMATWKPLRNWSCSGPCDGVC